MAAHRAGLAVHPSHAEAFDCLHGDQRGVRHLHGGDLGRCWRSPRQQSARRRAPAAVAGRGAWGRRGVRHHRRHRRGTVVRRRAPDRARPLAHLVRHRWPRAARRPRFAALLRGVDSAQHQPELARGDGRAGRAPVAQVHHSHARVGDAVFRVYQDSAMIVNLLQEALIGPFTALFWTLLALVLLYLLSPTIAVACIFVGVPMVWLTAVFTPRIRRRARENRLANSDLTSRLQESFAAIKVVKANRAEARILDRFHHDSHRALDAAFHLRLDIVLLTAAAMTLGGTVAIGAEYVLAGWVIEERETYRGAAVAALIGFAVWNLGAFRYAREQVEEGLGNSFWLIRIWCMTQDLFIGLERAFFLLDLEPDIIDGEDPRRFPTPLRSVTCREVHFSYELPAHLTDSARDGASRFPEGPSPTNPTPTNGGDRLPVLRGVDLVAHAGTVTAIVGATGSGKSTLMSMILRLYDPERGAVAFNDTDIRDLRVDDIRASTAIALQKNVLFAGTVADNIGYAAEGKTMADVEAAAKVACAHEFIGEMENGYQTELGERGGKLSTGQRQRLSIARAIVRDTPILILDEPTASLDALTERELLGNLAEWGKDRVVFLITHRLSTIRDADQIAFLEDGRIFETGTHDELMTRPNGRYRSFVQAETVGLEAAG
ncbi:MAG: ABC transporter ATP-binding protein [Gammaproteobacteria bacterium]|nr:ABC transporter ATP-binding protein [Gammaproteobacteria bacterium]